MGYVKSNSANELKNYTMPDGSTLYDLIYNSDGTSNVQNVDIADSRDDYGNRTLQVRTHSMPTSGYTTTAAGDGGTTDRYQMQLAYTSPSGNSSSSMTVSFNPSNTDSLNRTLINFPGSEGWAHCGVEGYNKGGYNNYLLENDDGYMTINIEGCGGGTGIDTAAYQISEQIQQTYGNVSADHRYVISGASAGANSTVEMARIIIEGRGDSNHSPIDIMLLDGEGSNRTFVDNIKSTPVVRDELVNTGSVIYAYESQDPKIGGTNGHRIAINNLGELAEQGLVVVEKDPTNGAYRYHSGSDSNELMLSNGESRKVVNEAFDPNNETNKYNLILPEKEANGDYKTQEITEKQLSSYTEFRKTIGKTEEVSYLKKLESDDMDTIVPIDPKQNDTETKSEKETETKPTSKTTTETEKEDKRVAEKSTGIDESTRIKYDSIVDSANEIVKSINQTSFRDTSKSNYQFCNDSTATFPESLNQANSFLFATSGNLLNNITHDLNNIGNILESYALMDQELANETGLLNGGVGGNNTAESTDINVGKYIDTDYMATNLFEPMKKGEAGKITGTDISGMLNGDLLGGVIGNSLHAEQQDARDLKATVEGLLNNPNINSPEWTLMQKRLEEYDACCDARIKATEILEDAYVDALKYVQDYMNPDEYLDDGETATYEANKQAAESRVKVLEAENKQLAEIKLVETTVYDEEGNPHTESNAAEYYAAQAKITANELELEQLAVDIAEYNRMLDKLYGWADALNHANDIVDQAVKSVNQLYGNEVNAMNPVDVTPYRPDAIGASGTAPGLTPPAGQTGGGTAPAGAAGNGNSGGGTVASPPTKGGSGNSGGSGGSGGGGGGAKPAPSNDGADSLGQKGLDQKKMKKLRKKMNPKTGEIEYEYVEADEIGELIDPSDELQFEKANGDIIGIREDGSATSIMKIDDSINKDGKPVSDFKKAKEGNGIEALAAGQHDAKFQGKQAINGGEVEFTSMKNASSTIEKAGKGGILASEYAKIQKGKTVEAVAAGQHDAQFTAKSAITNNKGTYGNMVSASSSFEKSANNGVFAGEFAKAKEGNAIEAVIGNQQEAQFTAKPAIIEHNGTFSNMVNASSSFEKSANNAVIADQYAKAQTGTTIYGDIGMTGEFSKLKNNQLIDYNLVDGGFIGERALETAESDYSPIYNSAEMQVRYNELFDMLGNRKENETKKSD